MFMLPINFPSPDAVRYEDLRRRVHRQVNSSAAQAERRTVIIRQPGERVDDWDKLLEQLEIEESVQLTRLDDRAIQLSWTNQHR